MTRVEAPSWAAELAKKAQELHAETPIKSLEFKELTVDENYTTFFAEYELRGGDMVVHLFPRAGAEDKYFVGQYIDRCIACRSQVPPLRHPLQLLPCPRCGKTGRVYVPGRLERRVENLNFPMGTGSAIKGAVNEVWLGDAAMDYVEELGAWAVKFFRAASVATGHGPGLLDRFLEKVDQRLDELC